MDLRKNIGKISGKNSLRIWFRYWKILIYWDETCNIKLTILKWTIWFKNRKTYYHIKKSRESWRANCCLAGSLWLCSAVSCLTLCDFRGCSRQAPLSMGLSQQGCWTGLPFPSPGDVPNPGTESRSPTLQAILYHLSHQGSPVCLYFSVKWRN